MLKCIAEPGHGISRLGSPLTPQPYMMKSCCFLSLWVLVLGLCTVSTAAAQERSPISIEASAGVGSGIGGPAARYRTGAAVDALLAVRVGTLPHGSLLIGLAGGVQGAPTREDICILTPGRACVPEFPIFFSVAPLVGWENPGGTLRLLTGPASFQPDAGDATVGLAARLDASTPPRWRLAPVISVRANVLPRYEGDVIGLGAIGIGCGFGKPAVGGWMPGAGRRAYD